jgi:hypothetical protein
MVSQGMGGGKKLKVEKDVKVAKRLDTADVI